MNTIIKASSRTARVRKGAIIRKREGRQEGGGGRN